MADKGYMLGAGAIDQIKKLVRINAPPPASSQIGSRGAPPPPVPRDFPAEITGNSGTVGSPFSYAWSEMSEDPAGSGNLIVKPGGLSGTTSANAAKNDAEISPVNYTGPVANGTIVRIKPSFNAAGNPYFRFNLFQLPALAQYQSWQGTVIGGATVTTVTPDYTRCS